MGKKFNPHHHVTPWVAYVIIAAIGSTFVYFIQASANESWGYDYIYPSFNKTVSRLITKSQTVGWNTYKDEGYGFQISHPVKYNSTVSSIVASSVLGQYPGTTVGPLVFVKLDTPGLRASGNTVFNKYWNYRGRTESPTDYCAKGVIDNTGLDIRVATCVKNGKKSNYAFIKGKTFDIFVDGATSGYNKNLLDAYGSAGSAVSQTEFTQILSTFKFI